jgi:hypothetical protein
MSFNEIAICVEFQEFILMQGVNVGTKGSTRVRWWEYSIVELAARLRRFDKQLRARQSQVLNR